MIKAGEGGARRAPLLVGFGLSISTGVGCEAFYSPRMEGVSRRTRTRI